MNESVLKKRESIIRRHKELFDEYSEEERRSAFDKAVNFFKDIGTVDFDNIKTKAILKK